MMRINPVIACSVMIAALASTEDTTAQNRPVPLTAPNVPAPTIAERADQLLKEVGAYIGSAEQFTFHADIIFDHVMPV